MGIQDRDYMKRRPPGDDPDGGNSNYSADQSDARNAKLLKRMALVFGGVIVAAVLITVVALVLGK